ncbi:O-methyltransferase-domain-containing protein [Mycena maculata]|uniref:O-methyltransferase-domain-containing protein n=1 Tax=Mycena maculata TaxID=230809 RepID=A0AAD7MFZ2_9AGAR|nr:O-methyltransferase-domain-containing protein [Mycena maculata]
MSPVPEKPTVLVIRTRFAELLKTIEQSAAALRIAVETEQSSTSAALSSNSDDTGARIAAEMGLSFHANLEMAGQAAVLRVASERLAQLVTPPRHVLFEASGSVVSLDRHCNDTSSFLAHYSLMYEGTLALPYWTQFLDARSSGIEPLPLSPFAIYTSNQPFYQWIHSSSPAAIGRGANFNSAMKGMSYTEGVAFLPADYPFAKFPEGTTIVDVGGGLGSLPDLVLPVAPHLKFVVQDLGAVIKQAMEGGACGEWVKKGRVEFSVQDCFSPQPEDLCGGNVFVLKTMLHNYADSQASEILTHIRAANPSQLLIIDRVIFPQLLTQASTAEAEQEIHKKLREGGAQSLTIPTMYDLAMVALHGGRERLFPEWRALLEKTGFNVSAVYPMRASTGQFIVDCVPI